MAIDKLTQKRREQIQTILYALEASISLYEQKEKKDGWGVNFNFPLVVKNRNDYAGWIAQRDLYIRMLSDDDNDAQNQRSMP